MASPRFWGAFSLALVASVIFSVISAPFVAVVRQARYVWRDFIVPAIAAAFPISREFPHWLVRGPSDRIEHVQRAQVISFQALRERRTPTRRQMACSGSIGAGLIAA